MAMRKRLESGTQETDVHKTIRRLGAEACRPDPRDPYTRIQ